MSVELTNPLVLELINAGFTVGIEPYVLTDWRCKRCEAEMDKNTVRILVPARFVCPAESTFSEQLPNVLEMMRQPVCKYAYWCVLCAYLFFNDVPATM